MCLIIGKRSKLDIDGKHPSHVYGHGAVKEEGMIHSVAIGPSKDVPPTPCSGSLPKHLNHDTAEVFVKNNNAVEVSRKETLSDHAPDRGRHR